MEFQGRASGKREMQEKFHHRKIAYAVGNENAHK
jgi:hypothetical protein